MMSVNDIYSNAAKAGEMQADNNFVRFHESPNYYQYAISGRSNNVCVGRKSKSIAITIDGKVDGAAIRDRAKKGLSCVLNTTIDNSLSSMPGIYPSGIPMLAMQMTDIYRQKYWTGSTDKEGKKLQPSDYITIERRPDKAYWQDVFYAKFANNIDLSPEGLLKNITNMPGQQVVNGSSSSDISVEPVKVKNNMYARKIIKNTMYDKSIAAYGIDYAAEQMKNATIEYTLTDLYLTFSGTPAMPGLALLGNNQITLGTSAAQNLLGGFSGTTLDADLSFDDVQKIAQGLLKIIKGIKDGSGNSWDEPILAVSDSAYIRMRSALGMGTVAEGQPLVIGPNRLGLFEREIGEVKILPLATLKANNRYNTSHKDTFLLYNRTDVKKMEIQPFELYGNWETGDGMNFACYVTAQSTQPYLVDEDRMFRFVAA